MLVKKINLYENRDDVTLTTYLIDDSAELLNGKKRPAVIVCPGGAYLSCSDREGEPVALRFAAMGYHAFVLRYSVQSENKPFNFMDAVMHPEPKEHIVYPNAMRDIGSAMKYLHDHSEAWLVDTDRIAICGFSAGAHNCAMYSTNWYKEIIAGHLQVDPESIRPAACILGYTLSDYVFMKERFPTMAPMEQGLFTASNTVFTGTGDPSDELLTEISPARNVSDKTPPTYLWTTAADNLVPVQHSLRMAHALADHKIPFEMHIFEEGDHGLSLATQATAGSLSEIKVDAAKWMPLCEEWLKKRFSFDLPAQNSFEASIV